MNVIGTNKLIKLCQKMTKIIVNFYYLNVFYYNIKKLQKNNNIFSLNILTYYKK